MINLTLPVQAIIFKFGIVGDFIGFGLPNSSDSPISEDCRPSCDLKFPLIYKNESTIEQGHIEINSDGSVFIYPKSGEAFTDALIECNSFTYCSPNVI